MKKKYKLRVLDHFTTTSREILSSTGRESERTDTILLLLSKPFYDGYKRMQGVAINYLNKCNNKLKLQPQTFFPLKQSQYCIFNCTNLKW